MLAVDRTGQQLAKYYLLRMLASSRFADIYLCKAEHSKQQYVLKLFHTYLSNSEQRTFNEQAEALTHLSHPNIVPVLDYGVEATDNAPWLLMVYIPGNTLRQRYPLGSRLPLAEIVSYVQQLAAVLQYAHEQQVVHQNIRPENIFLARDGRLLLSDFTLPVVALHPSAEHEGALTLAAMPPELSRNDAQPVSDQYALAALAFEWLTGERWSHSDGVDGPQPIKRLHRKLPALSPLIEDVLQTALQADPERRFKNINAFATAFTQAYNENQGLLVGSIPPSADVPHASVTPKVKRQRANRSGLLLLLICVIVLLGLLASTLMHFTNNGKQQSKAPASATAHTPVASSTTKATTTPTSAATATSTPPISDTPTQVSVAGTVLYQANWSQGWSGSADWGVSNQELINNGSSQDQGPTPTIVAPYTVNRADYAVEIHARATAQWPCFDAGILRGFTDTNGWHGYKAAICDQKIRLQAGNNDSVLVSVPFQPGNAWHTYRFEAQGSLLRFYVDGNLLAQTSDTRYPSGGSVGLKSYETYLEVSDLKIIAL